jgi:hypothetical protein
MSDSAANHRPASFTPGNDAGCNPFPWFKSQTAMTSDFNIPQAL